MPVIGSVLEQLWQEGDVHGASHHSGTLGGFLRGGLGRVGLKASSTLVQRWSVLCLCTACLSQTMCHPLISKS